jgi:hypothetical protein
MLAGGVRTEYELARNQGLYVIPIGASGWTTSVGWLSSFNRGVTLASRPGKMFAMSCTRSCQSSAAVLLRRKRGRSRPR